VTFDKPFTVKGSGQYVEKGSEIGHPLTRRAGHDPQGAGSRGGAAEAEPVLPAGGEGRHPRRPGLYGKQTSESLLFRPDPVRYKKTTKQSREAAARNAQSAAEQRPAARSVSFASSCFRCWGQQGQDTIRKAREFDKAAQKKKKRKPRSVSARNPGSSRPHGRLPNTRTPDGEEVRARPERLRAPDPPGIRLQPGTSVSPAGAIGIAQIMPATAERGASTPRPEARPVARRRGAKN
jgi:hypothetical protein